MVMIPATCYRIQNLFTRLLTILSDEVVHCSSYISCVGDQCCRLYREWLKFVAGRFLILLQCSAAAIGLSVSLKNLQVLNLMPFGSFAQVSDSWLLAFLSAINFVSQVFRKSHSCSEEQMFFRSMFSISSRRRQ